MANTPSTNFTPTFQVSSAANDIADVTVGTVMLSAFDLHTHDTNKGAAVWRLRSGATASLPAAGTVGRVYIGNDGTKFMYYDDGAAQHTVVTLDQAQTLVNKTLTLAILTTPSIAAGFPTVAQEIGWSAGHLTVGDGAANHMVVDRDSVETLINKTLTSPILTTPTIKAVQGVPNARMHLGSAQSIPNNAITQVTIDTADFDSDTMTATTHQLTAKTAGVYLVIGQVFFQNPSTGERAVYVYVNGVTSRIEAGPLTTTGTNGSAVNASGLVSLAVNDVLTLQAFQTQGGAVNAGASDTFLSALRVSN